MTTRCMQNQLATRSDGVIAAGLRRSRIISSLTALYAAAAERATRDIGIERSQIHQVVDGLMGAAGRRAHGGAR